jgi:hypothetical protein
VITSAGSTFTVTVAAFPAESVTLTVSVTPPSVPAVYRPAAVIAAPEVLDVIFQVYPAPDPPVTEKLMVPPTATSGVAGEIARGASTVTFVVAELPTESVTRTVSVTPLVAPAVYAPCEVIEPPEFPAASDHVYPLPDPPAAENVTVPPATTAGAEGAITSTASTATVAVPMSPAESVTFKVSVTPPVVPAV